MADVSNAFVSHIHEDDDRIHEMKRLLDGSGFKVRDSSVRSDGPNKATDENYIKYSILAPRIDWAGTMIVLISPGTKDSEWVNWEIEYAARQGKRIVGVWAEGAEDCDVPEALDRLADAVVSWEADRIIGAITGEVNNWTKADGAPATRHITRYSCS